LRVPRGFASRISSQHQQNPVEREVTMRSATYVLVGSAVLMTACQDVWGPTGPDATVDQRGVVDEANGQAAVAREVPSFGGVFLNEAGRPTAYVTDLAAGDAVRSGLAGLAREQGFSPGDIVLLRGDFPYAQLSEAFARATHAVMPLAGSVFTDLDEARNRVVVGVEHVGLMASARAALARAGLAAGSYEVTVTDPIHPVATLRDEFDPTQGGIQIHFTQFLCTLGLNVNDGTQRSFLTNSHCTATQGGVESTVYYQPTSSVDGTVIATEVEDPTYFRNGACPRGRRCRYSDSSRALYSTAQASTLGAIAITSAPNTGSITVTGTRNVAGTSSSVVVGTTVSKVGRTTGWTQAGVSRTCVNTGVSGTNIVQLCQHWVQHGSATIVAGGDSGSSVWTGSTSATIVGLLWGGSSDNRTFVFSPIGQVQQELGTMTVN
jgi:hypothetical protein